MSSTKTDKELYDRTGVSEILQSHGITTDEWLAILRDESGGGFYRRVYFPRANK